MMSKHPALQMSKVRQDAWLKHAKPEDFFEMITLLARLYAKKKYDPKLGYRASQLLEAYPEYVKEQVKNTVYKNNVPFRSLGASPPEVTVEEVEQTIQEKTLDELMDLI